MVVVQVARRIRRYDRRVAPALGKTGRTAKVQTDRRNGDLREGQWLIQALAYAEIGWIQGLHWREGDVNSIEAQPGLVHEVGTEGMGLGEREYLAMRLPHIAESRNCIPLQNRLSSQVFLKGIVAVDAVVSGNPVGDIASPLVNVNRCRCRTHEAELCSSRCDDG